MTGSTSSSKLAEDNIWAGDRLNRRDDADYIRTFIVNRLEERAAAGKKRNYVLNLDAGWGRGKTFFLERFAAEAKHQGHIVAYVNAWRDDFSDDPFVAVMSALDAAVQPHIPKTGAILNAYKAVTANFGGVLWAGVKGVAGQVLKKALGDGVADIAEIVGDPTTAEQRAAGEKSNTDAALSAGSEAITRELSDRLARKAIDGFAAAQESVAGFKDRLEGLLEKLSKKGDIPMPLYVLVDELDRCRPPFAISMLERVKHLFEVDNVVFLVATDTEQLKHSIRAVYGSDFSAGTYLNRFFDRTYRFDQPDTLPYIQQLLDTAPLHTDRVFLFDADMGRFMSDSFDYFGASLRDIEQAYDLVRTVASTWSHPVPLQLGALLPLAIAQVRTIEPTLSMELIDELERSRSKEWKQRREIGFKATVYGLGASGSSRVQMTPSNLFTEYVALVGSSLPAIAKSNIRSGLTQLVEEKFLEEFSVLYQNQHRPGREPYSLISEYPNLIRKAGRLLR
jgi:hypothetical protein